jgi:starch synthase
VVADGETGLLVPIEQLSDGTGTPVDPDAFVAALAATMTELITDPQRAAAMGQAGRRRAVERFSWSRIAEDTLSVYRSVL